jgi:hypothetical protein
MYLLYPPLESSIDGLPTTISFIVTKDFFVNAKYRTVISGRGFLGLPQRGISFISQIDLVETVGAQCRIIF